MSNNNGFDKNHEEASEAKFVFVEEGASDEGYGYENEQTVSVGDDVFYQELAQDVLENNVQNKLAKDSAAADASEGFDDDDEEIPEISGDFVDETDDAEEEDDVIEISVASDAYVSEFLNSDSTAASGEAEESEVEEVYDEEEAEVEEVYDEAEEESEVEEVYDEAEEESEVEEIYDETEEESEAEEIYDDEEESEVEEIYEDEEESEVEEIYEDEEESEAEEIYEDEEESEDEEIYDEAEEESDNNSAGGNFYAAYGAAQGIENAEEEPENLYSVGEAEPASAGKVDIMGYLSEEALSEINASFESADAEPAQPASLDMDRTQVYAPVSGGSAYGSESGYVDIDDDDTDDYEETPRPQRTHRRKKRRSNLKGVAQIASLLIVVAGLTWLISRAAFSALGKSANENDTSSDLLYGYSSNVSIVSFDDSSDDDVSSEEEEFNVVSLSLGDKNDLVLKVQRALSSLGYLAYSDVRGTYDNTTKEAVATFQKANSLTATGVVDKTTYYALFDSNSSAAPTVTTELPTTTTIATESTTETTTTTTEPTTVTTSTNATTAHTTIKTTEKTTTVKKTTTTEKITKKTTTTTEKTTKKTTTTEKTTKKTTTTENPTTTTEKTTTTEPTTSTTTTTAKPTTTTTQAPLPDPVTTSKTQPPVEPPSEDEGVVG